MQNTLVRPLTDADHDQWLVLWRGYQTFYKVDLAPEVSRITWNRLLDPSEPMHGSVAVAGESLIGLAHWIRHRSTWTTDDYCYLQDLFVTPAARGAGAGRQLIQHVRSEAERDGCSRVYWLTHETNQDAMKLYDQVAIKSGFVQYRIDPR